MFQVRPAKNARNSGPVDRSLVMPHSEHSIAEKRQPLGAPCVGHGKVQRASPLLAPSPIGDTEAEKRRPCPSPSARRPKGRRGKAKPQIQHPISKRVRGQPAVSGCRPEKGGEVTVKGQQRTQGSPPSLSPKPKQGKNSKASDFRPVSRLPLCLRGESFSIGIPSFPSRQLPAGKACRSTPETFSSP